MPRKSRKVPAYLLHQATGQARVRIDGKDHYLGPYGSSESYEKYDEKLSEWLDSQPSADQLFNELSLSEMLTLFWSHAKKRYGKSGKGKYGAAVNWRPIIKLLRTQLGPEKARSIKPRMIKGLLPQMEAMGWSLPYANKQLSRIKQIFNWAAEEGYLPNSTYRALADMSGFRAGENELKIRPPVLPVADELVEETIPHLPGRVAAMVRIQRYTGMRPGEVIQMCPGDIDRSGEIWIYTPPQHKTRHHGKQRPILIGPKAQAVLAPYLLRLPGAPCFPSRLGQPYTTDSYRRAIHRVCKREGLEKWSPNQLRHTFATEVQAAAGIEAVRAVLGHSDPKTSAIYAERDIELAAKIARKIG